MRSVDASVTSARRTLAALAGTALILFVMGLGASPAGAATDVPVVDSHAVPAAVGMVPAQLSDPAD